jgi:hypothetical protein
MSNIIRAAFNGSLSTFATSESLDVAWENFDYTPTDDPYLRPVLLPGQTQAAGCGPDAKNVHSGVYQVDVIYPTSAGWGDCSIMADKVVSHFKRGTKLSDNRILVFGSSQGPAMPEGVRFKIPVSVTYMAWLDNE